MQYSLQIYIVGAAFGSPQVTNIIIVARTAKGGPYNSYLHKQAGERNQTHRFNASKRAQQANRERGQADASLA